MRWKTACRRSINRAGRFPQVSGMKSRLRRASAGGQDRIVSLEIATASRSIRPANTRSPRTISCSAAAMAMAALGRGRTLIGKTDGTLMANVVMGYVRQIGRVTSKVEGRIVAK
jgi:5'-nucleotidase/UDP-sugar diphosphatase